MIPQFEVAGYRIDLVVEGMQGRLAVECDGDAWHGPERYEQDMARQRILERCGWTFWRVRGSWFYREPEKALEGLWTTLDRLQILATSAGRDTGLSSSASEHTGSLTATRFKTPIMRDALGDREISSEEALGEDTGIVENDRADESTRRETSPLLPSPLGQEPSDLFEELTAQVLTRCGLSSPPISEMDAKTPSIFCARFRWIRSFQGLWRSSRSKAPCPAIGPIGCTPSQWGFNVWGASSVQALTALCVRRHC